ncbi:MAG: hypothetical protein V3R68_06985, partial [Gammaproteobacteria bacterium]
MPAVIQYKNNVAGVKIILDKPALFNLTLTALHVIDYNRHSNEVVTGKEKKRAMEGEGYGCK